MPVYKIAGLNVSYEPKYSLLKERSEKYRCDESPDFRIGVNDSLVDEQLERYKNALDEAGLEYLWIGAAFNLKLLEYNGLLWTARRIRFPPRVQRENQRTHHFGLSFSANVLLLLTMTRRHTERLTEGIIFSEPLFPERMILM